MTHRIVAGDSLLTSSDDEARVTLAHEVGHATQRWGILMDVAPLVVFACIGCGFSVLAYFEGRNKIVMIMTLIAWIAMLAVGERWFSRWFEPRYISRELHTDAISAKLCGSEKALALLRTFSTTGAVSPEIRARLEHLEALAGDSANG